MLDRFDALFGFGDLDLVGTQGNQDEIGLVVGDELRDVAVVAPVRDVARGLVFQRGAHAGFFEQLTELDAEGSGEGVAQLEDARALG